jgi:hypothetical protein
MTDDENGIERERLDIAVGRRVTIERIPSQLGEPGELCDNPRR